MANRQLDFKIIQVIKTTAEWATWEAAELSAGRTGIITQGILCCEKMTDGHTQIKVGDGTHKYSELGYITDHAIEQLGNIFTVKGVVASTSLLPTTGNRTGDVYFVGPKSGAQGSDQYAEYIWVESGAWEYLGEVASAVTIVTYSLSGATKKSGEETLVITLTGSDGSTSTAEVKVSGGLVIDTTTNAIKHSNSITAGTASGSATTTLSFGGTFDIPTVTYDAQGHITAKGTTTMTMPANPDHDTTYSIANPTDGSDGAKVLTLTAGGSGSGTSTATFGVASTTSSGLMSSGDKTKLNGIATGAEVNQNAFSNVKVGSTTIAAGAKTDTIELVGSGVTITPDATNKKITIASNATAVSVTDTVNTGDTIATITVDSTPYTIKNNVQTTAIATDSGTPSVSLAANSTYKLTAGNSSVIFKTPADTTYTGGDCITITNGAINHDAPSTAPTGGFKKVTLDTYGHVTATSAVAWSDITGISNNKASSSQLGLVKLSSNGNISIDSNGVISVTSDNALSDSSTNPVQNAVVTSALADKLDVNDSYVITCIL